MVLSWQGLVALLGLAISGVGETAAADSVAVRAALDSQDRWLGDGPKRDRWNQYLLVDDLRKQIQLGQGADPKVLERVLRRYEADEPGLDLGPFQRVSRDIEAWRRELLTDSGELAELVLAHQTDLGPISTETYQAARDRLAQAAVSLETALRPGASQGEAWKDYLQWSAVQGQLEESAELDLRALQTTFDLLTSGEEGLERPEFQAAAQATGELLDLGLLNRVPAQAEFFQRQATLLAADLQRDPRGRDPRVSRQIERRLTWLTALGQTPDLTATLRRELVRPNLYVVAEERVLELLARRPVSEVRPIRDNILGTRITGTGLTSGSISLNLLPSSTAARLQFGLGGTIDSNTRGINGPVVICTAGDTCFRGVKTVELTDDSFRVLPASMGARTRSRTRSITKRGGPLGKRIVEAIAERKVDEARGQANAIASRKAERMVAGEFDEQVTEEVRQARRRYDDLVRKPLRRRGAAPQQVAFSTSSDALFVSALLATPRQIAAAEPPPTALAGDLSVRLHQSALNNLADAFLGGATIQQRTEEGPTEIDAVLPPRLSEALARSSRESARSRPADAPPFRPWKIVLRRERPVSFELTEGLVRIIIHSDQIQSDDDIYPDWDLILTYQPRREGSGWQADLVGEIDVLPSSFDPGAPGARIPSKQRALRRNLAKQLTARLKETPQFRRIALHAIDLARLNKPGLRQLELRDLVSRDGWISLAFEAQ